MNYDYYRVFLAVAKHHSITRAANELYTSQPAVSRTIKNLESDLGVKLFSRSKQGVELTEDGKLLYDRVSQAFLLIQKGEEEVSLSGGLKSGSIRLGATITALDEYLFDFIERFRSLYPEVKIRISTQSSDATISLLKSGVIDIAFVTTPFHAGEELEDRHLSDFDNVFICGNDYKELIHGVHTIAELSSYPLVYLSSSMQLREYSDAIFEQSGINVTPSFELDSASTIVPMVAKNLGIGLVPKSLVKDGLEKGVIHVIKTDVSLPKRSVHMLSNPSFPKSAAARRFFELAK